MKRRVAHRAAAARWAMLLSIALVGGACGDSLVIPSPAPTVLASAAIEQARTFREKFGLRADEAWIVTVAKDPSSQAGIEQFGVPLLPTELSEMIARTKAATDAGPIILDYAGTVPDDWYGSYIDQQRGGVIVAQFFRNTDRHRAALALLLPPSARWEVRQVDQRTLDMIAFVARVKADRAWFGTIDAELLDVATNPLYGGIVELTYIAARRDLDAAILDHYGAPDWLRVERAGGPPWTGPVGDLVVKAVDPAGRPVEGLICSLGGGDAALSTDRDGICRLPDLAAVSYRVQLVAMAEPSYVAGSADVIVTPNRTTTVKILVRMR
jgi:hypothetical protein